MTDVTALIDSAQTTAQSMSTLAQAEMAGAGQQLNDIITGAGLGALPSTGVTIPDYAPIVFGTPPSLSALDIDTSGLPGGAPSVTAIPDPLSGVAAAPTFSANVPSMNFPAQPGAAPDLSAQMPSINTSFSVPGMPSNIDPGAVPVMAAISVPSAPTIDVPAFSGQRPNMPAINTTDPSTATMSNASSMSLQMGNTLAAMATSYLYEINPQYQTQLAALENQLSVYLQGGTGFNPTVENAIYERGRSKADAEYRRTSDTVYADAATKGFTMPTGAIMSAVNQARQAAADNNAVAANAIMVKQAEIEQANLQFAVTTSAALRQTVLNAMNAYFSNLAQINGQAVQAAIAIANTAVGMYDVAVKIYNSQVDMYRADATVYDAQLRGATAAAEIYRSQVSALESQAHIEIAQIEGYKAAVEATLAAAQVYRAQVDGVVAQAQLEKLKVEVFGAQVQAYVAQVQGKAAEWQGYSAAVQGEEAKMGSYVAQARAYEAQVGGYKAAVEAKGLQIQAAGISNKSALDAYTASFEAYSAKMHAMASKAGAEGEFQRNLISEYAQSNSAAVAQATAQAERYRLISQVAIEEGRLQATIKQENAKVNLAAAQGIAQTSIAAAGVYSSMAGAALGGMNTLVTAQQS